MRWPWARRADVENVTRSIADPTLVQWFNPSAPLDIAGVQVGETSALSNSALFRGVSLIAGTLAGLPFNTWTGEGPSRRRVPSVFDNPDGPDGQTLFEWKESAFVHLVLHGKCGAMKVRNQAGGLVRLPLVHPLTFAAEAPTYEEYQSGTLPAGGVWFRVQLNDGKQVKLDAEDFWYVPAMSTDGILGRGILNTARGSVATTLAGDKAAAKTFSTGALISGLATPDDEVDITDDLPEIRRQLHNAVSGADNAGAIALVNRRLKFSPWTMTAQQAQFIESRQFQIEEVARWTGVPPHLLMQVEKQTSWGTGVDEQNRGLSKFVLGQWSMRFQERASRLLAAPRSVEFDFAGLERPNFAVEIDLLIKQVQAGLLTLNEARAIRNLPPLPEPETPQSAPAPAGEEDDDDPPAE